MLKSPVLLDYRYFHAFAGKLSSWQVGKICWTTLWKQLSPPRLCKEMLPPRPHHRFFREKYILVRQVYRSK